MNKDEEQRTQLLRQEVNLESNEGREQKARSLGYKRANENPIPLLPAKN